MQPRHALALEAIDLSDIAFWQRPEEEREGAFLALREQDPVRFFAEPDIPGIPRGDGYWAVTRHADILHVSRHPELFSSARGGVNVIDQPADFGEFFGSMIVMDDPRHARLRRIVSRGFTPGMLKNVEKSVEEAATRIVDDVIEKGSCDFVEDIAAALPLKIICDMMGIPESEYRYVFERSNVILGAGDPEYVPDPLVAIPRLLQAGQDLSSLMQDLARHRRERPTDDLTSVLIHAEVDGEKLTDAEVGSFFVLLAVAGNETTRNAISHGMKALCDNPDQRRRWMQDFDRLAPTAVEEIVRWATPVIHFRRTATADAEVGGRKVREGDKVVMWYNSGNRDAAVFDDPFEFRIDRSPNEHAGFGGPGPHFCMGAHLARREITVMFRHLFRRLPDLEVTEEPARLLSFFIHGIKRMRCEFRPGRRSAG